MKPAKLNNYSRTGLTNRLVVLRSMLLAAWSSSPLYCQGNAVKELFYTMRSSFMPELFCLSTLRS